MDEHLTAPTPAAPHDTELEAQVVGAIISFYALNSALTPDHCYDPRHAAILATWRYVGHPVPTYAVVHDPARDAHFAVLRYGQQFDRALTALYPVRPERVIIYAGLIAARAPVTTSRDVARLRLYAWQRHRLEQLDDERRAILGAS